MSRRAFVAAVASTVIAAPFAIDAQQHSSKLHRIGFLGSESAANQASWLEALQAGLRDLGYVEGQNLIIEVRWAEGNYDLLPALAAELVDLKVSVVVASGTKALLAMRRATATIPIVIGSTGDPVALGLVTNLARPGGNITGSTSFGSEITAKRLELLKEAVPRVARIGYLVNASNPPSSLEAMEAVTKALKIELRQYKARNPGEFDGAIAKMVQQRIDAIVVQGDTMFMVNARSLADLAIKYRLPSAGILEYAEAGGMMGSGADLTENHRRAAIYVDKILKGTKPGDLPIEQATKFRLILNLKTAQALGLAVPQALVLRADDVIR